MKRICRYLSVTLLLFCCLQIGGAQSLIDMNVGFGAVNDKASSTGIQSDPTSATYFGGCTPTGGSCVATSSLSGFTMGLGANLMLWKHFGVGLDAIIQPGKANYAQLPAYPGVGYPSIALKSRVTFYDINGIYQPVNTKRTTLQLIGGIGGANTKFYESYVASGSPLGASNTSQYLQSANHFQIHGGVGVQIYLNDHVYIRPQFDIHLVPNFTEQFGSKIATQEMVWLGYTFGDR